MIRIHAAWMLPISGPPVRNGWLAIDRRARIMASGRRTASDTRSSGLFEDIDLGNVVVLPGLVNAHTHLELSYLRDEVPPAPAFVSWIRSVMAARRKRPDPRSPEIMAAIEQAVAEAEASGTAVVGDITNTLATYEPLARSRMAATVFYELIRFNAPDPAALVNAAIADIDALEPTSRVRASLAAHAPYSVAPLVLRAIRAAVDREAVMPCSVHLSESAEEVQFIKTGEGPWRSLLEELGVWDPRWIPPRVSPVQFLDEAGFLGANVLAVHGVQMSLDDLGRLKARGTTLVTCPRSNGHTGAGAPPIQDFYDAGVRVAIGTDSLASSPDLNMFAELATLRALAPAVPASALLASATQEGARALGFEGEYGTLDIGCRARLIAVTIPPDTDDVEEYLMSGIEPSQLRWVPI